jgi:hypothetical protein
MIPSNGNDKSNTDVRLFILYVRKDAYTSKKNDRQW